MISFFFPGSGSHSKDGSVDCFQRGALMYSRKGVDFASSIQPSAILAAYGLGLDGSSDEDPLLEDADRDDPREVRLDGLLLLGGLLPADVPFTKRPMRVTTMAQGSEWTYWVRSWARTRLPL
jgi:hypothetical protein